MSSASSVSICVNLYQYLCHPYLTMTSIHNFIYGIPKLTCSPPNWSTWQKNVEVILESEDHFSTVYGSATSPTDPTQQTLWQKWDKHAYIIIYLLVSSDKHHVIAQASLGSNAWPLLKAGLDRKSTRLNSSHNQRSRMPSSA